MAATNDTWEALIQATQQAQAESQARQEKIAELTAKRDEYVQRLDLGAVKIEEAIGQGRDVTTWEDYWIHLLRQYEAVCDKLRDLNQQC